MMTCHDVQPFLSAYLDRELPVADLAEVSLHLESCARCQKEKQSLLQLKEVLRRQPMPGIPADLIAEIEAETIFKPRWYELALFRRVAIPALGVAGALAGWLLLRHQPTVQKGVPVEMVTAPIPSSATIVLHHSEERDLEQEVH